MLQQQQQQQAAQQAAAQAQLNAAAAATAVPGQVSLLCLADVSVERQSPDGELQLPVGALLLGTRAVLCSSPISGHTHTFPTEPEHGFHGRWFPSRDLKKQH